MKDGKLQPYLGNLIGLFLECPECGQPHLILDQTFEKGFAYLVMYCDKKKQLVGVTVPKKQIEEGMKEITRQTKQIERVRRTRRIAG